MNQHQDNRPVALVTGGSGGVGGHVCRLLAGRGHAVAFSYRSGVDAARALEAELGGSVTGHPLDLTDADAVAATVATVAQHHGRIDAVVHAAGPYVTQTYVARTTAEQLRHHVEGELMAFHHLVSATLPHLRVRGGAIVAVTTFALRRFPARDALSSIPKGGVEAMVRALAVEEGKFGVRANCVGPGALADGMSLTSRATGDIPQELIEQVIPSIPMRRLGTAREVAAAAAFLAGDEATYISGQFLDVDGGFSA